MKECNQCGKCCIKYGDGRLSASKAEIDLWELFNPEIFQYVKNNEIWFDPETHERLSQCPFLERIPQLSANSADKYSCTIYLNRPEDCRHYPSLISEMIRDDCEMIEITDISQPRRAQQQLDKLMQDSRPASTSKD